MSSAHGLIQDWRGYLAEGSPGLHLADSVHPLQIFIGATNGGSPRMVVRTTVKPVKPALSQVVHVERYEDGSGKWNLSLSLRDRKFDEVFLRLADDVHFRSAVAPNEPAAMDRVNTVFNEWRRLLQPRPTSLLSMEELRGLVGELWLITHQFTSTRSAEAAIEGWLGPMGLPQDFWFPADGYFEAKTVGPSTLHVQISSENQLDLPDLQLIVLRAANTNDQTAGAFTLTSLVQKLRSELAAAGSSADPLDERLARLGVDLGEEFYEETWFVLTEVARYDVGDGFPRIVASGLPAGVGRVSYQIELTGLKKFLLSTTKVG